jgi:exodeoxyribonuclease-1
MQKTYLFYDLETTGRSKCFDQALQFAAIRTDLELNELSRHSLHIKLNIDAIPDPEAILIHRIPIANMLEGESEIDAISQIHALLNTPGTISGGYNTLGFDDEFLRFLFHRNLLPPYTHQWANGCGRFDLYPLAQLYNLYHPACLQWPTTPEGKISLKLENLSRANQLAEGPAHQAMTDVEATLALARIFMKNKEMWTYAMDFFNKESDQKRREKITSALETAHGKYQLALLVGKAGSSDFFQYPVLALGAHQHYKNQTLWLRLDKPELATTTQDIFTETTWVARQKAGETFLLPFSGRFKQHITPERAVIIQKNLQWLTQNGPLLGEIQRYYQHYKYPDIPNLDVDASLYASGFLSRDEEQLCIQFHTVAKEKKATVAERFQNPRLQAIAARVMGRHYPQYSTPNLADKFSVYMQHLNPAREEDAPVDWRGEKRLTAKMALQKIAAVKEAKQVDDEGLCLLNDLEKYIREREQLART